MRTSRMAGSSRQPQFAAVLNRLEKLYVTGALVVFSGAFLPSIQLARGQSLDISQGDRLIQAIILPIFLIAASITVIDLGRSLRTTARAPLTLLLVCLAITSTLWSELPALTLRRGLALAGTTVFGIYFVTRFDSRTRIHLLAWALSIVVLGSLLLVIALPAHGTTGWGVDTPWRGAFTDKNSFGRMMVLSMAVFLVMASGGLGRRWLLWLLAAVSAYLVVQSHSATALVILVSLVLLFPLYLSLRLHYSRFIPIAIWAILIGTVSTLVVVARSEQILSSLGRDATLTGRTQLWEAVLIHIRDHFWLGHGYSAFWTGWGGLAGEIWAALSWEPPHSHNGFLDLWLDLGLVGLTLCLTDVLLSLRRSISAAAAPLPSTELWGVVFWTVLLLSNVSESVLVRQNSLFWVLYVATVAATRQKWLASPGQDESQIATSHDAMPSPMLAGLSPGIRRRLARHRRGGVPDAR